MWLWVDSGSKDSEGENLAICLARILEIIKRREIEVEVEVAVEAELALKKAA